MKQDLSRPAVLYRSVLYMVLLALVLGSATAVVLAQTDAPMNARAKRYGDGWDCDRGYRKVSQSCVAVKVPTNARLDYSGDGWECNRGYRRV